MHRIVLTTGFLLLACGTLPAQPVRKVVLSPAAVPVPALKYPLLPELRDLKPGNAAPRYREARKTLQKLAMAVGDANLTSIDRWVSSPRQLRADIADAREYFAVLKPALDEIEDASRHDQCDWDVFAKVDETGALDYSDAQRIRFFAFAYQGYVVFSLADNRVDDAIRGARVLFAMARHAGAGQTLIHYLVGTAITAIAYAQVERISQFPGAPNLYWSLTDLPHPFLDMRPAMQGERLYFDRIFPGLSAAAADPKGSPLTDEKLNVLTRRIDQFGLFSGRDGRRKLDLLARFLPGLEKVPLPTEEIQRFCVGLDIQRKHPEAKRALMAKGWSAETLDRLPPLHVAMLHALPEYERDLDDMRKLVSLPFWQAEPALRKLESRLYYEDGSAAVPLGRQLVPTITKVMNARARVEWQGTAWRCIEAIRLYAVAHGKLPASLADIKEVPVPLDPVTGRAIDYTCDGKKATLKLTRHHGELPLYTPIYELTLRR
jgi:hypothetical protein